MKRKYLRYNIEFWGIMALALTAEWWMDLLMGILG